MLSLWVAEMATNPRELVATPKVHLMEVWSVCCSNYARAETDGANPLILRQINCVLLREIGQPTLSYFKPSEPAVKGNTN